MPSSKNHLKNEWRYTEFRDLVSTQLEVTKLSYDTHSHEYAEEWEWNDAVKEITMRDYLGPFMETIVKKGVVLVVGCGTGRDLVTLEENGFRYLGIDVSTGMLKEAVLSRKVGGPVLCSSLETIGLIENSFDGVLIDSAVEHIKKTDMEFVLEKIYKSLRIGGVCLLRFRIGSGNVFKVEDSVGVRYFNSYTKEESMEIVTSNGFKVDRDYCTNHLNSSRPGFHTYFLRK